MILNSIYLFSSNGSGNKGLFEITVDVDMSLENKGPIKLLIRRSPKWHGHIKILSETELGTPMCKFLYKMHEDKHSLLIFLI